IRAVTHDLNNALAIIRTNAELMVDEAFDLRGISKQELLLGILEAVQSASDLTRRLHAISGAQAREVESTVPGPTPGRPREAAAAALPTAPRQNILLVEDEPLLRAALATLLRQLDYHTFEAESAAQAMPLLESNEVDCLLTDVMLPGDHSGVDLAAWACRRRPALRVLYISGADPSSLGLPADAMFLSKPISRLSIDRTLRQLLAHSGG
ncbi:MAG: response regulator, partial [Myxococcales bacterium]|nr:response regulator [Myxococcales bacterium]